MTLGIPLSFIGSLVLFHPAGLTLNQGTLFAFFLLIGIVVDDAVVVGESIIAHRKKGISGLEASISGARMVFGPLFVGAITTLLALFPLMFIDTGIGQVVKVIPVVAAFVLAISLLEAFLILPAHLANDKPWSAPPLSNWQRAVRNYLDKLRDTVVLSTASWAVRNSWLALLLTIFLIVGAFLLLRFETIPVVFADGREGINNTIRVEITMPAGTPFAITEKMVDHFREAALMVNDEYEGKAIKSISTVVGSILTTRSDENDRYGENIAMVNAQLFDKEDRSAEILEIEKAWRQFVGQTDQIENVEYFTTVIKTKPNLSYSLRHEDFAVLQDAAASIQAEMADISGIFDIKDNLKYGNRQFEIQITPEGEVAGFTPANIGTQLRARLYGLEVQRLQRGNEEIKVIVNYPEQSRTSISDLSNIRLDRPGKGQVPLSAIARIVEKQELEEITQLDGNRVVYVNAKADTATITPRSARKLLENGIIKDLTEKYPDLIIDRAGSALDERDTLNTLILLVPLSLLAIYLLMAAFLRSYWKPIIAAAGIPLTFVGAVLAHLILGWNFTFISIFGIIAASGVVVNDGLVLLDRYESIRRESPSLPAVAALVSATRLRFRPVLLTSLTTVLGLSPLLYERSDVLLHMVPFAASILGGLIMSGLYVLFLMPAMVMIVEGRDE
ncbi:MAG: efflux RND transporter permease subunit [Rhodobacteraceae bacterium]|nr:efflux RND transporter permease subunit [Paracoccaceae bacterium]